MSYICWAKAGAAKAATDAAMAKVRRMAARSQKSGVSKSACTPRGRGPGRSVEDEQTDERKSEVLARAREGEKM